MAATLPTKVIRFKELEKDFGTTVSTALWKKAGQLMNYINASIPIGKLLFVRTVQPGALTLDPKYWQLCDGSVISNSESPMNGVTTPNFTDKFVRHPATGEMVYSTGGSTSVNVLHRHRLSTVTDLGAHDADNNNDVYTGSYHTHFMFINLSTFNPTPEYHSFKIYVRIV